MNRLLLMAMAALSLTACQTPALNDVVTSPAPLAKTAIDDSALEAAWKGHDALQDALNLAMDLKPSLIGTPAARRVADINDAITAALTAAESAAAAGETTNYLVALANAKKALTEMRGAILLLKGK
jgi:hypothetical protein